MLTCYVCGEEIKRRKDAIQLFDQTFHERVYVCCQSCQEEFLVIEDDEKKEQELAELRTE